jgi:molecular chaperone HscB
MTTTPSTGSAPLAQECRDCGGTAPLDAHFCPQCSRILSLGRHGDYFTFMGLPKKLNLDADAIEKRFRELSRQFHPDYFYNASPEERRASLSRSSYLNDAYRTLRDPSARIDYLLGLEGLAAKSPQEASRQVPPALLEEVFALNEELDEIRDLRGGGAPTDEWRPRLDRAREPIDAKRASHEARLAELSARWDALVDGSAAEADRRSVLEALRDVMLERNYIANLLSGIEKELNAERHG